MQAVLRQPQSGLFAHSRALLRAVPVSGQDLRQGHLEPGHRPVAAFALYSAAVPRCMPASETVAANAVPRENPALPENEVRRAMTTPVTPQDEARLLERFRSGDREAFGELVQRYQRQVYFLVWRYVRNDEDAKDLTQATFVRAWGNAAGFRGDASIRTWLYRIAANLAMNHRRDRGRWLPSGVEPEDLPVDSAATERLVEAETSKQLLHAVEQLPPKQRLVVELRVQEGLSFREVADAAECSEDAAKANFHHAIKRLRTLLAGTGRADRT
jgi:RNA polymerase sigma-70 factor (ECF subfamily)